MKLSLLFITFFFLTYSSTCQSVNYCVFYDYYLVPDTGNLGKVHEEVMALRVSSLGSEYYSQTDIDQKEKMQQLLKRANESEQSHINFGHYLKTDQDRIYFFRKGIYPNQLYIVKKFRSNQYLIPDSPPQIQWKIISKTKKIGNFLCQLAACELDGENYEAWFTSDIPLPFGPWKLYGLPGLILEATNSNATKKYVFQKLETLPDSQPISLPKDAITADLKTFKRMVQAASNSNQSRPSDVKVEEVKEN